MFGSENLGNPNYDNFTVWCVDKWNSYRLVG
jgi:hypothetical protein